MIKIYTGIIGGALLGTIHDVKITPCIPMPSIKLDIKSLPNMSKHKATCLRNKKNRKRKQNRRKR